MLELVLALVQVGLRLISDTGGQTAQVEDCTVAKCTWQAKRAQLTR